MAAQQEAGFGTVAGVIVDPSGARVAGAQIQAECGSSRREGTSDRNGAFSLPLPAGSCDLSFDFGGFDHAVRRDIPVRPGQRSELSIRLTLPTHIEQLTVPSDLSRNGIGLGENRNGLVLEGEAIDQLSSDQRTLRQQLLALAGGSDQHMPEILVDGFSGARIPPKSAIRQIRINSNVYSAEYDHFGLGRLEITTRPGTQQLHGSLELLANDSPWNAANPYSAGAQPPYHALQGSGAVGGRLGSSSSFAVSGQHFEQQNFAVVNVIDLTGPASQAIPAPETTDTYSLRLDRALGSDDTLTGRYEFNRDTLQNGGVGRLVLPSEGYNNDTITQTLQIGNTQVLSPKLVSETRFQYLRTRLDQSAVSAAPTVLVEGTYDGGGSPAGSIRDHTDRFEFQEYVSLEHGKQLLRMGARYRLAREANASTANFNGEYIYPSLAAAQASQPSQFFVTRGSPHATIVSGDVGVFGEEEWKVRENLTLTGGLRFESQSAIPDHADWAPRLSASWAVGQRANKAPILSLHGGFGIFYYPFELSNLLTSVRQNGITQQTFYGLSPQSALAAQPSVYQVSPHLHRAYDLQGDFGVEHSFGSKLTVSLDYSDLRGVHQYLSRNSNAPLPGTFSYNQQTSGVRPLGGDGNLYQFSSDGMAYGRYVYLSTNYQPTQRINVAAFYIYQRAFADAARATDFASDPYHLAADYGRLDGNQTHRLTLIASLNLPSSIALQCLLLARSGTPFNITTGTDLNGDTIFNDRPSFATDLSRPSVVRTSYGDFDTIPVAGQRIVPYDFATSPAFALFQMSVSKAIPVGPRPQTDLRAGGSQARAERPWAMRFTAEVDNVPNHNNPGIPVGVLSSPLFGKSISLAQGVSTNEAANRMIWLRGAFEF